MRTPKKPEDLCYTCANSGRRFTCGRSAYVVCRRVDAAASVAVATECKYWTPRNAQTSEN